jgi:mediator of RNA polymerase II transcription subunit 12
MLRQWSRFGADITEAFLSFLDSKVCERGRNKAALYHLISELARSEHFSTPVYLQWIIARGGLDKATDVARNGPCATRLLAELPTHNLSESIAALRATLLSRVDFSVDDEEAQTRSYMVFLNHILPGMQANVDLELESGQATYGNPAELFSQLNRTSKSELGLWLRQKVGLQMLQPTIPPLEDWDDPPTKEGTSAITAFLFNTIRHQLELLEDYSILADVLKIATGSNDAEVLASCADTLDLHSDIFAAIGALNGLFEVLMTRLRSLGEDDIFPRVLLVAMSDLAAQIPEQKMIAQQLAQELARSDRKTAADACSPVSDHIAGVMQTAEADFTDEIEKVLASGNSMDQATLERLFQRIALRLESSWEKSPEQHRSCGLLFTRLRTFDAQQFDVLMAAWVKRFLQMQIRPSISQVLGPLISFGCLSLREIVGNYQSEVMNVISLPSMDTTNIAGEMLALIIASPSIPEAITAEESYRLRIKQKQLQRDHHVEVLAVIRQAIEELNTRIYATKNRGVDFQSLLSSQEFDELLQRLVLIDTDSTILILVKALLAVGAMTGITAINAIVDRLVAANRCQGGQEQIPIEMILDLADDFTLPFCQVKLALMFSTDNAGTVTSEDGSSERLEAFDNAIESAVAAENTTWACILPLLDISIAQHLRARAETQFLALYPSSKSITEDISTIQSRVKQAENLLYIIDATAYSMTAPSSNSSLVSEIVTAFNNIFFFLANPQSLPLQMKDLLFTKWLPLLLSFTTIHISAFEATKSGHESRAKALIVLAAIILELQALENSTDTITTLTEQTFDLALQLVDLLPEDIRQQCIRGLRDTTSNPRISYLFSIASNPIEWLFLSQKEKIAGPVAADGRAITLEKEKLTPYTLRRWEMLGEPTPNVGENDTSLSLTLFSARRG